MKRLSAAKEGHMFSQSSLEVLMGNHEVQHCQHGTRLMQNLAAQTTLVCQLAHAGIPNLSNKPV